AVALGLAGSGYMLWLAPVAPAPPSPQAPNFAGTQRIALVVGNAKYRSLPRLNNPEHDADSVTAELEKRGFRLLKAIDGDRAQTIGGMTDFESTLAVVGGIGLFYYAGNAVYIDGEDIMLPVDATEDRQQSRIEGGVNLTKLQAQVQAKTTRKMVDNGSAV